MDDEALHVGHVGQQGEDLQRVDELPGCLLPALYLEGEDAGSALGEVLLVEHMVGMRREGRMVHLRDERVLREVLHHLQRVLRVSLDAEGQRLDALQENPGIEGRDGSPCVAQNDGTDAGHEGCCSGHVGKHGSVVRGIGLGNGRVAVGVGFPVELAAIDDDSAQRRAVAPDELRGRVYHDVCPMFQGPNEERGEGVIDDEDDAVPMRHFCHAFQVQDVAVGVAQRLGIDDFRIGSDGRFQSLEVVHRHDGVRNALCGKGMRDEVVRAAVQVVGRHDVVASLHDVLQRVGDSRGSGGDGECCYTAFEGSDALLQHALCGVGQASVDVSGIAKAETVRGVLRVVEHVACGLIDRHGTSICSGVGNLSCMQGNRLEVLFLCTHSV